jgi:hypothetical protein
MASPKNPITLQTAPPTSLHLNTPIPDVQNRHPTIQQKKTQSHPPPPRQKELELQTQAQDFL